MSTIRGTGVGDLSQEFLDSATFRKACSRTAKAKSKGKQRTLEKFGLHEICFDAHETGPYRTFEYCHYHSLPLELSEIFSTHEFPENENQSTHVRMITRSRDNIFSKYPLDVAAFNSAHDAEEIEEIAVTLLEALECRQLSTRLEVAHTIFCFLVGDILYGSPTTSERTVRVAVALGDSLKLLVSLLKETFDQRETPYWNSQETGVAYIHQSVLLSILYILMECHRDDEEFMVELANTGLSSYLLQRLSEYAMTLEQVLQLIPIRKLLLVLSRSLSVSFHSLNTETRKSFRSGQESVSCHARADDFRRQKEARDTFRVQVPQAFEEADAIVRRSLHQCPDSYLTEELPLAGRLEDALSHLARVVVQYGEKACQVLLQLLHSVGPHESQGTRLDTTAELSVEDQETSERLRLHDVMLKAITSTLLTLMKTLRTYNLYVFRFWCDLLDDNNAIAVLLTSLHCDLQPFLHREYPASPLFGPGLEGENEANSFSHRNMNSLVSCLRILKKVVHQNTVRERTMVHYKAPVICKRLLSVDCVIVRYHVLKLLKPLIKHLNNRWKSKNTSILSAIALQVPQDLMDEWILPLENDQTSAQEQEQTRTRTRQEIQQLMES